MTPRPTHRPRLAGLVATLVAATAWANAGLHSPAAAVPAVEPAPQVTVTPDTGLDPEAATTTVTITGTGFTKADADTNPDGLGVYVRWCVATAGRPAATDCMNAPQHWVGPTAPPSTAVLAPGGTFSVTLDVPAAFTSGAASYDCTVVECGVHVRRDHNGGSADLSYDSFTPVAFAAPAEPTTTSTSTTSTTTTSTPPAAGTGTLDWGVKANFRAYVLQGPAQGAVEVTAPAVPNPDGTVRFLAGSPVTYAGPADVLAQFEGAVRFTGHHGALDLSLLDPRVEIDGADGVLVVDASSKDLDTGEVTVLDDVVIADLDVDAAQTTAVDDVVTFASIPATLTDAGAEAFGGFYAAGDPLDPVTFSIEVDDVGALPTPTEELAGCVPAEVEAGSQVAVCGEGFAPGEQVQVFLHSEPVFLAVVVAGADGSVSATVTIPADTGAAEHRIELRGVTSGRVLFTDVFAVVRQALARTGSGTVLPAVAGGMLLLVGAGLVRRSRQPAFAS